MSVNDSPSSPLIQSCTFVRSVQSWPSTVSINPSMSRWLNLAPNKLADMP
jgi:hypothetical protein